MSEEVDLSVMDNPENKEEEQSKENTQHPQDASSASSGLTPEEQANEGTSFEITCYGKTFTVNVDPEQLRRIKTITRPKPIPDETNAYQVLSDHRLSVQNWAQLILNLIIEQVAHHDERKLEQTTEEHHKEAHHWPLDGGPDNPLEIGILAVVEALADYFATAFGRYLAGRGPCEWIGPTSEILARDVMNSTALDVLQRYNLASVDPNPMSQEDSNV